jgi:hypothetical protein
MLQKGSKTKSYRLDYYRSSSFRLHRRPGTLWVVQANVDILSSVICGMLVNGIQLMITSLSRVEARNATLPSTLGFNPSYLSPLNPRASAGETQQNVCFVTSLKSNKTRQLAALAALPRPDCARTYINDWWKGWTGAQGRPNQCQLCPGVKWMAPVQCLGRSLMSMLSHLPAAVHLVHDLRLR